MFDHTDSNDESNLNNAIYELENRLKMVEATGVTDPYAFSSRTLIQATFPHSARAGNELVLRNGNMTVTMYSRNGLPYGRYPRLIMCWLTREALRRNRHYPLDEARRIPLGSSLNAFLREVGVIRGVYNGDPAAKNPKKRASGDSYKAVREQLIRLFSTTISIDYDRTTRGRQGTGWDNVMVSEEGFLWWDETTLQEDTPENYVLLTEKFFRDLVDNAVPLDAIHLAGISTYPMAIDLYCWATYRIATHKGFTRVTWDQLKGQMGTSYPDTAQGKRDFRKKARAALKAVNKVWPEANITDWKGGLELHGNDPAVAKKDRQKFFDDEPNF